MKRQIIKIDEEKCNGCGLCAKACHEGAIAMVNGKAKLIRDDYCDGLGNCLPVCPTGAITFEQREAAAYDEEAVKENQSKGAQTKMQEMMKKQGMTFPPAGGCPGSRAQTLQQPHNGGCPGSRAMALGGAGEEAAEAAPAAHAAASCLRQWPVQIKLVPVNAPYFDGANLLIAADCAAYARANFHEEFMRNKITVIGCPKLDEGDYSEKLTEIIRRNNLKSVTVVRMEVPCCGGIEQAAVTALKNSGKFIPWQVVTLSVDGRILD
ncbi:MAG: 4Fe-4S binding protein [Oscillospiraceae bacterium]